MTQQNAIQLEKFAVITEQTRDIQAALCRLRYAIADWAEHLDIEMTEAIEDELFRWDDGLGDATEAYNRMLLRLGSIASDTCYENGDPVIATVAFTPIEKEADEEESEEEEDEDPEPVSEELANRVNHLEQALHQANQRLEEANQLTDRLGQRLRNQPDPTLITSKARYIDQHLEALEKLWLEEKYDAADRKLRGLLKTARELHTYMEDHQ